MNEEMLKNSGRLAQKELELKETEIRISGLVSLIRDCLDPFADIRDLRADDAARHAMDLADLRIRWNEIRHKIQALKNALGR